MNVRAEERFVARWIYYKAIYNCAFAAWKLEYVTQTLRHLRSFSGWAARDKHCSAALQHRPTTCKRLSGLVERRPPGQRQTQDQIPRSSSESDTSL